YAQVQANPVGFIGTVLDLRGFIDGYVRRDNSVTFILTLDDKRTVFLSTASQESTTVERAGHQIMRALVRIMPGAAGNVPPTEVIAVATDLDVTALDESRKPAPRPPAQRPQVPASRSAT